MTFEREIEGFKVTVTKWGNFQAVKGETKFTEKSLSDIEEIIKIHKAKQRKIKKPIEVIWIQKDVLAKITSEHAKYPDRYWISYKGHEGKNTKTYQSLESYQKPNFVLRTEENVRILQRILGLQKRINDLRTTIETLRKTYKDPVKSIGEE